MTDSNRIYMQYGCGWDAPEGWLNFDGSPTLRFERLPILGRLYTKNSTRFPSNVMFGNIVKGLPISDESCSGIYSSHVLEHLCLDDALAALANTRRYLVKGGIFRIVVPDLKQLAMNYLATDHPNAAPTFMRDSFLGKSSRSRGLRGFVTEWLGNSAHLWMWDEHSLSDALSDAGFVNIRLAKFGDSEDRRFSDVEKKARFDGCLAMQCTR